MTKELHYLSFGANNNLELQRQLTFFNVVAKGISVKSNFYCFQFGDEDYQDCEEITFIGIDQSEHFFEVFEQHLIKGTVFFNHAYFYPYLISKFEGELNAFIYHKVALEYVKMKHEGIEEELVSLHRMREVEMLENSDWVYLSSERILNYFCDNDGYHNHKHSLLSMNPIEMSIKDYDKDPFYDDGVHYIHTGDISNKGLKYVKRIFKHSKNKFTLLANNPNSVSKQGFVKDERFRILSLTSDNISRCMAYSDFALIKPPTNISDWIDIEYFLADILCQGVQLLMPESWSAAWRSGFEDSIFSLEGNTFSDSKLPSSKREKTQTTARQYFDLQSEVNELKLRNLNLLHLEMVNK